MFPLRCPMHHAGTFHSSLLPTPSTRRHRRPGAQAARRTSRTCTHGAYWEGRSTASSWDFCVKINQCVGRHNVLISAQVDFYDRSVLGEGIHCLKCGSFVNLPRDGDPMVQCPYCAYRWCVRCKCPWHPNIKCSERADVEVEEWREAHGAQRCPGCFKIIEKDDPESCNHMTHKNTDVMPCTRERTDFCYCLCGNQPVSQVRVDGVGPEI